MILRRVSVRGFRCFREPIELVLPDAPVVVLAGPNGAGKSTLLEAVVRCLLDNHNVTGDAVQALRPWGADLAPEIEVEFEHGGHAWRARKRFLDRPFSTLERRAADGRWSAVAENRGADERLRELLAAEEIKRGLAKQTHSSLLRVLVTPQGRLPLGSLSGPLLEQVREALGASLAGEAGRKAEKRLREVYERWFTDAGKERKASPVRRLRDAAEKARERAADAVKAMNEIEAFRAQVKTAARELEAAQAALAKLRPELEAAGTAEAEWKRLKQEERLAEAEQRAASTSLQALEKAVAEIGRLRKELAERRQKKVEAEKGTQEAEVAEAAARKKLEEAEADYRAARSREEELRQLERRLEAGREWQAIAREQESLRGLLARVGEIGGEIEKLRGRIAALQAPERTTLDRVRKLAAEIARLDGRIDAALVHAEFVPEIAAGVTVLEGEPRATRRLEPGEVFEVAGEGKVEIEIAGVGRFRARGPAGDLTALRAQRDEAAERLAALTAPFGASDPGVLEQRLRERERLEAEIEKLETERITRLGERSEDGVERRLEELAARRAELAAEYPEWKSAAPDLEAAEAEVEALRKTVGRELEEAERRRRERQELAVRKQVEHAERRSELEKLENEIEEKQKRLAELESDGLSEDQRSEELRKRKLRWEDLTRKLEETKRKLGELPAGIEERAAELRERAAELERTVREKERARMNAEADLGAALRRAPYEVYAEAEEERNAVERELAAAEREAEAVRLAWQCLAQAKQAALGDLAGPVAEEAAGLLERIAGRRLADFELGGDFAVAGLRPPEGPPKVPVEEFSGGEQEQIHLAVRLALARILTGRERHLVVLDDVLLNTDDERLGRIFELIEEWSGRVQLLILTCHPERYRTLGAARFLELAGNRIHEVEAADRAAG